MAEKRGGTPQKRNPAKSTPSNQKKQNNQRRRSTVESENVRDPGVGDEIIIIAAALFSLLLVLSYFNICGVFGTWLNTAVFGLFGVFGYIFPAALFVSVLFAISNRGNRYAVRKLIYGILTMIFFAALIQLIFGGYEEKLKIFDYFTHSMLTYDGAVPAYGGLFGGIICMVLCPLVGNIAAICIVCAAILILIMLITGKALLSYIRKSIAGSAHEKTGKRPKIREEKDYFEVREPADDSDIPRRRIRLQTPVVIERIPTGDTLDDSEDDFIELLKDKGKSFGAGKSDAVSESKTKSKTRAAAIELEEISRKYIPEEAQTDIDDSSKANEEDAIYSQELKRKFGNRQKIDVPVLRKSPYAGEIKIVHEEAVVDTKLIEDIIREDELNKNMLIQPSDIEVQSPDTEVQSPEEVQSPDTDVQSPEEMKSPDTEVQQSVPEVGEDLAAEKKYVFPPISLLTKSKKSSKGVSEKEMSETAAKLESIFESFGVGVTVTDVSCGPTVTRYELHPEQGVKVSRITGLTDDIKLNLAAADIRIEAPIPGKAAVGIEIPNKENVAVLLRDLIESDEFMKHKSNIAFAVGKDIAGKTVVTDIAKMPHLLIAGATGSGKSVCINTLIMSILYKASPHDVKLIMVDPKVVELNVYNGIPHLLIPVVTDPKKASAALNWAVVEMTNRYKIFAELGVRDLKGYNEKVEEMLLKSDDSKDEPTVLMNRLPQIVIIVDELADLMMVAPGEVEDSICRLAQLARAAGIHLIIATQRPSVNVITGLIKANIPSRVAFAVSSAIDSRTIIDSGGAEKLLGRGDMLFFPSGYPKPVRLQGAFVSDKEVNEVVDFLKSQGKPDIDYSEEITSQIASVEAASETPGSANARDEYFADAGRFIIEKDKASIGMLQRVYKIGFNRAARIMDQLCEAGVVGPEEGTKPRKILMSAEELEQFLVQ